MIVSVIYEYGIFGEYEVTEVSNVLIGFSFGLPAYVLIRIFSSVFYSMADTKNPFKYSLMAIVINIVYQSHYLLILVSLELLMQHLYLHGFML